MPNFGNIIANMYNMANPNANTEWKFDPNKSTEENLQAKIEAEKARRGKAGLEGDLSPEWLAQAQTEISQSAMGNQAQELINPNSNYYKSIGKQIRSQLTGAMSPNSLLAQMVAAGGSPAQAKEQMKAMEGRISDTAGNLTNQYYLNASGQGNSLLSSLGQLSQQNAQFQTGIKHESDMYDKQKSDSLTNTLLSGALTIGGTLLGSPAGGAIGGGLSSMFGGGGSGNTQMASQFKSMNPYFRMK